MADLGASALPTLGGTFGKRFPRSCTLINTDAFINIAPMPITRIVSGGQTGTDRGGLQAAIYCDVSHGGWCPKGRKAEDGVIPPRYQLHEMTSADYLKRTEQNVIDSDATLVFTLGRLSGGSLRAVKFAHAHEKPWLHIDVDATSRERAVELIVDWLEGRGSYDHDEYAAQPPDECVLNVAGSRESKADGMEDLVMAMKSTHRREGLHTAGDLCILPLTST